jgi:hypothetical protein
MIVGSGCAPPRFQTLPFEGGLSHGTGFTGFEAQVKPNVYRVSLRFQDGDAVNLRPVEGHVLYDIPQTQWSLGHRLVIAVAYDRSGKMLSTQQFHPQQTGVYDCKKTVPIGAGQRACP